MTFSAWCFAAARNIAIIHWFHYFMTNGMECNLDSMFYQHESKVNFLLVVQPVLIAGCHILMFCNVPQPALLPLWTVGNGLRLAQGLWYFG